MTLVATPGLIIPPWPFPGSLAPSYSSSLLIDATGEKAAFMGRFWNKDGATKDITKVGFQFGAVTKAGGSALTVSLQDVSLTTGPPEVPDETQDQTVAVANGNASFATNTWIQTGALSGNRTTAYGELLAVVIEYDGSGRLSSDSVVIRGLSIAGASGRIIHDGMPSLKTGGTWAAQSSTANAVILECTDGTFGTLGPPGLVGNYPTSALTNTTFNSGSAADELALRFVLPFNCIVDGAFIGMQTGTSSADFSIVLYQGTTAMTGGTVAFDANAVFAASTSATAWAPFAAPINLTAGVEYFLALKPTTTNNISTFDMSVNASGHFQAFPGGVDFYFASRVDAGSWTTVTTRRLLAGLSISDIDSGTPPPSYMLGI